MRLHKNTILTMLLGLMLFVSAAGIAQTTAQGDQKKKSEACCSSDSCCKGDSCQMKEDGTANAEAKESCCSGDSCDMKAKHDAKNHKECCKKHKDAKNKAKQK